MHKSLFLFLAIFILNASQGWADTHQSMRKITGLKTPESVLQAKDGRIFVSEINVFGKDGDGQISMIDTHGNVTVFATGLDDPKGLAMIGQTLYVADKNKIISIAPDGNPRVFVAAEQFDYPPKFLNDLEADLAGNLYVSDSGDILGQGGGSAIYKISPAGHVSLLLSDKQNAALKAANGLLADDTGNFLLVVDFASGILYSLNTQSRQLTDIAEGFGGGDGIVHHSSGTMYVSDWKNGKVFAVDTKGDVKLLKAGYQAAADIAITKDERFLLVPDMKAGVLDFIPLD